MMKVGEFWKQINETDRIDTCARYGNLRLTVFETRSWANLAVPYMCLPSRDSSSLTTIKTIRKFHTGSTLMGIVRCGQSQQRWTVSCSGHCKIMGKVTINSTIIGLKKLPSSLAVLELRRRVRASAALHFARALKGIQITNLLTLKLSELTRFSDSHANLMEWTDERSGFEM